MIFVVDWPALFTESTFDAVALRRQQRFLIETSAINSFSFSVILLILSDLLVRFEPVNMIVNFYDQVCGHKESKRE
jgi:hypothetical protein